VRTVDLKIPPPQFAGPQVAQTAEPQPSAPAKKPGYRARREGMFALTTLGSASVVMLGDSLTERAQWSEITGCPYLVNRGIGADDSAGVLRRLDEVTKLNPSAVFLMIGVNDVVSSVPTETIIDNVRRTIATLNNAGARVYLTLVLPVTQGFPRKINPKVTELNAAYIALAHETKTTLVDFRAGMRTEDGFLRDEMSLDGIHLNPAGYRVWRDAVTPLVRSYCQPRSDLVAGVMPAKVTAPVVLPARAAPPELTTASIAPVRPAIARGQWIIQVGAYPEEDKAKERIRKAQQLGKAMLANADPFTERVVKAGQELFRARFAGFNQSAAEAACSYFKRNAIDCIAVRK
jgi:lysophospholipase L1-like esterase